MTRAALVMWLVACAHPSAPPDPAPDGPAPFIPPLGARYDADGGVTFRVASTRATRIELWLFDDPHGDARSHVVMTRDADGVWQAQLAASELPAIVYYAFRVWGPNWPYDPAWTPGSDAGRIADVDSAGNRMNPNKLVFDPYARELSHDPGADAAKGIVLHDEALELGPRPLRAFADDAIYEVHLRGLTERDAGPCAGTYAGAAARAGYLADLGITAVELMPVQETSNDRNDSDPNSTSGDNYWGYSTLAYFAPDRRYACDGSPGGPTREFAAMVRALHERGLKVYIDVVYNHTAEGGGGGLQSLRGLDNAGYYQLDRAGTGFTNNNGVGADLAADKPLARGLIRDSLHYWRDTLGVDGFRFDLAPVLGNSCGPGCFEFDPAFHAELADEFARPRLGGDGADLIAEPWSVVPGSYQVGGFPAGWAEWNDRFRDTIRKDQNIGGITPGALAERILGSSGIYRGAGRFPAASINYIVSHDGFTLADLYACNGPNNKQPWPYGPSDGGDANNNSWDHNGDPVQQRQAARTGLALLLLSEGVPMLVGGDERLRSQHCNNNPFNVDSVGTWLDLGAPETAFTTFARRMLQFRGAHPALRRADWVEPSQVSWRDAAGNVASAAYLDDASKPVLAWQLESALYVAYNRGTQNVRVTLPGAPAGTAWHRVADTASWMEPQANIVAPGAEERLGDQSRYDVGPRSLVLLVAR